MVGASSAVIETIETIETAETTSRAKPFSTDHTELVGLLATYPAGAFAAPESRVAWLLNTARELDRLGWTADATEARERALVIVRAVMGKVAGVAGSDR